MIVRRGRRQRRKRLSCESRFQNQACYGKLRARQNVRAAAKAIFISRRWHGRLILPMTGRRSRRHHRLFNRRALVACAGKQRRAVQFLDAKMRSREVCDRKEKEENRYAAKYVVLPSRLHKRDCNYSLTQQAKETAI